jgi:regulator of cell morphogenesis and NO signaling
VFQKYGIDYCCHGYHTLTSACEAKNVSIDLVQRELAEAAGYNAGDTDWSTRPLTELIGHILATHHQYLTRVMPQIALMTAKIADVHGQNHPEMVEVREIFAALKAELDSHMMKEEMILFPAIQQLEQGNLPPQAARRILGPVNVMLQEHEAAGRALELLRMHTNGYTVPADACNTYTATIKALEEFERDLHQHIHKENNILFPRAINSDAEYAEMRAGAAM